MIHRIRNLREDHDYTQAFLADHLHITQAAYSHYETGERAIPIDMLISIARFYNVILFSKRIDL